MQLTTLIRLMLLPVLFLSCQMNKQSPAKGRNQIDSSEKTGICINYADKIYLTQSEKNLFPQDFDVRMKVWDYYLTHHFSKLTALNETQEALCCYYVVDGMINNSGIYWIFVESQGRYNNGYLSALQLSGNTSDLENFSYVLKLFDLYRDSFINQNYPPEMDDNSNSFKPEIFTRLNEIEESWYNNSAQRDSLFEAYLFLNSDSLIIVR